MSKMKKIIISIITVIVLLLIGGSFYAGNFFVDYALYRPDGGSAASTQDGSSPQSEAYGNEIENKEKDWEMTNAWLPTVEKKNVEIQSEDGLTLRGIQYNSNPDSKKWAILVHGYQANNADMQREAMHFSQQQYNVLTPNMRAHGDSDGNYIGMGWLDRKDMLLWIDSIIAEHPDAEIVLYGESMGGATVMMTSGEELPENVKAIVEDCGYTSVYEMFTAQLSYRFGLPEFPFMHTSRIVANMRADYDIKEASALEQVKKSVTPTLFIHGSNDNYVPTDMVYEVFEACSAPKQMLVIEGAGHGASSDVEPQQYYFTIFEFLSMYVDQVPVAEL